MKNILNEEEFIEIQIQKQKQEMMKHCKFIDDQKKDIISIIESYIAKIEGAYK